jgi:hypothetical protein
MSRLLTFFNNGALKFLSNNQNPSSAVQVDAPIEGATMLALNQLAFGIERLVSTATTSMTLLRTSDGVQRTSSFNDIKAFNITEIATWAGGSTVELVDFIEQKAGIARLVPNTRPVVMTGGVWNARFGTSIDMTTATGGDLSRTDEGGCGVNINGIRFTLVGSGITTAEGLEVTTLTSSNTRKNQTASAVSADPKPSNSTTETIWRINAPANVSNVFDYRLCTGNILRFPRRLGAVSGNIITAGGNPVLGTTVKRFSTEVLTVGMTASTLFSYAKGSFISSIPNPVANAVEDGNLANGTLIIGSASATAQSSQADMVFGGIIITKTLTNKQRYLLQEKLQQVAHYHLRATTTELLDMADEVIDMRDVNPTTGLVAGKKGKNALQFNVSTPTATETATYSQTGNTLVVNKVGHGLVVGQKPKLVGTSGALIDGDYIITSVSPTVNPTSFTATAPTSQTTSGGLTYNFSPDWSFTHTVAENGLQGIRSADSAQGRHNPACDYVATNNYFAQTAKKAVSVLTFNRIEYTSGDLKYWFGVADSTDEGVAYYSHGRDHVVPSVEMKVDSVIDSLNYSLEQYGFVDNGGNQPMVKYSHKIAPSWNVPFTTTVAVTLNALYRFVITSGSVPLGTVLTNAWFKTNLGVDAPTPEFQKHGLELFTYEQYSNALDLMISTHKPSDAWDGVSSNINIKRATNHLYLGNSGLFGHADSSICRTESGNHYVSKSTSRIRRVRGGNNSAANGTLLMWMFFDRELTATEAQKLNVNMYKWYA